MGGAPLLAAPPGPRRAVGLKKCLPPHCGPAEGRRPWAREVPLPWEQPPCLPAHRHGRCCSGAGALWCLAPREVLLESEGDARAVQSLQPAGSWR